MGGLAPLLSQYQILKLTSQFLSTRDLIHLAATCSQFYSLIRKSESIFEHLKSEALCDGYGLEARQEFSGRYALGPDDYVFGDGRKAHYDEEVEVRVWNLNCDAVNALPCLKCGVNVCEECRWVPRVRDLPGWKACRRPHLDPAYESHTVICYCETCDPEIERNLPISLSVYCDCDQYTRWICLRCKNIEDKLDADYYLTRTKGEWDFDGDRDNGMWLHDHQQSRAFWCPCGTRAPSINGNVRCAWCKRRHNLKTWKDGDPDDIPFFDNDPCYPKMQWN